MFRLLFCLLIVAFQFFPASLTAQTRVEDVVYLKDGSIIRGMIIEQVPNQSLKIQTKDRNVFVYSIDQILKITKEEVPTARKTSVPLTADNIKKRGFTNITEVTVGKDILFNGSSEAIEETNNSASVPSVGVQTVNGYQFNPYITAGVGIGFHIYSDLVYVPLFADIRIHFVPGPTKPFISLAGGYSFTGKEIYGFNTDRKYFGGFYCNPAFGVKFQLRKNFALAGSLGYRYQEARILVTDYSNGYLYNYSNTSKWGDYTLGYLNFKFGLVF